MERGLWTFEERFKGLMNGTGWGQYAGLSRRSSLSTRYRYEDYDDGFFFLFTFLSFGRLLLLKLGRCSIQMESASLHIMVFGRVCRLLRGWPRLGDCVTKTW